MPGLCTYGIDSDTVYGGRRPARPVAGLTPVDVVCLVIGNGIGGAGRRRHGNAECCERTADGEGEEALFSEGSQLNGPICVLLNLSSGQLHPR